MFLRGELDLYWRDVAGHTVQIRGVMEDPGEAANGLRTTSNSLISASIKEVMAILTIFSAIMLPLSMISGIHGMNFIQLPWATHSMSFVIIMGLMVWVVAGMLAHFRREGWL